MTSCLLIQNQTNEEAKNQDSCEVENVMVMDTCSIPEIVADSAVRYPKTNSKFGEEDFLTSSPPPLNGAEVVKNGFEHIITNVNTPIGRTANLGQVLYQFPDTMTLYKVYNITIRISKDTNLSEVVLTDLKKNEEIKRTKIQVGSYMMVELKNDIESDPHFNITRINSTQQELDTTLYTTWNFRVEPIKVGESQLNLVISIINGNNKKEIVYSDKILVKNNITKKIVNWWETEWKWAFTTIIIPIFLYLWKKFKSKKEEEE